MRMKESEQFPESIPLLAVKDLLRKPLPIKEIAQKAKARTPLHFLWLLHSYRPFPFPPPELIQKLSVSQETNPKLARKLNISPRTLERIAKKIIAALLASQKKECLDQRVITDTKDQTIREAIRTLQDRERESRHFQEILQKGETLLQKKAPHWWDLLHEFAQKLTIEDMVTRYSLSLKPQQIMALNQRIRAYFDRRSSTGGFIRLANRIVLLRWKNERERWRKEEGKVPPGFLPLWLGQVADYLLEKTEKEKGASNDSLLKAKRNFLFFLKTLWYIALTQKELPYISEDFSSIALPQLVSDDQLKELMMLENTPYMEYLKEIIDIFVSTNPDKWQQPTEAIAKRLQEKYLSSIQISLPLLKNAVSQGLAVIVAILTLPNLPNLKKVTSPPPPKISRLASRIFQNSLFGETKKELDKALFS